MANSSTTPVHVEMKGNNVLYQPAEEIENYVVRRYVRNLFFSLCFTICNHLLFFSGDCPLLLQTLVPVSARACLSSTCVAPFATSPSRSTAIFGYCITRARCHPSISFYCRAPLPSSILSCFYSPSTLFPHSSVYSAPSLDISCLLLHLHNSIIPSRSF